MMNQKHSDCLSSKTTCKPNLYLIGFMGTGKSEVGRLLAPKLKLNFYDTDQAIEQLAGCTVKEIFAKQGETHFRYLERKFIEDGHPAQECLIACGGGLAIPSGMLDLLESKGIVVCLFASAKTIFRRTAEAKNTRPLLDQEDKKAAIDHLLQSRLPIYQKARFSVDTENRTTAEVTTHIASIYREETKNRKSVHAKIGKNCI